MSGPIFTASCKHGVAHGKTLAIGGVAFMTVTKLRLATWPGEQFVCGLGLSFTRACRLGTGTEGDNSLHNRC
jgi:hypothetical protein